MSVANGTVRLVPQGIPVDPAMLEQIQLYSQDGSIWGSDGNGIDIERLMATEIGQELYERMSAAETKKWQAHDLYTMWDREEDRIRSLRRALTRLSDEQLASIPAGMPDEWLISFLRDLL